MIIDGVGFNDDLVKKKTLKQFIKDMKHLGKSDDWLKHAYSLITGKKEEPKEPINGDD